MGERNRRLQQGAVEIRLDFKNAIAVLASRGCLEAQLRRFLFSKNARESLAGRLC